MTDKKRIILHAGAPKNGSTSLQAQISQLEPALNARGVAYCQRQVARGNVHPIHRIFLRLRKVDDGIGDDGMDLIQEGRRLIKETIEEHDAHTLIISSESVMGEPLHNPPRVHLFPYRDRMAKHLSALFDGYDVTILYMIRPWTRFLPSFYTQHVRQGSVETLDQYLADLDASTCDWHAQAQALATVCGMDRVHVAALEEKVLCDRGKPKSLYQRMAQATGLPDLVPADADRRRNPSPGERGLLLMRLANKIIGKGTRGSWRYRFRRRVIHSGITRLFAGRESTPVLDHPQLEHAYKDQIKAIKAAGFRQW